MNAGEFEMHPSIKTPPEVMIFANIWKNTHKDMFPDSYVLDICEYKDELKVVEVNSLLTSGWYECDIDKIVKSIIRTVEKT